MRPLHTITLLTKLKSCNEISLFTPSIISLPLHICCCCCCCILYAGQLHWPLVACRLTSSSSKAADRRPAHSTQLTKHQCMLPYSLRSVCAAPMSAMSNTARRTCACECAAASNVLSLALVDVLFFCVARYARLCMACGFGGFVATLSNSCW